MEVLWRWLIPRNVLTVHVFCYVTCTAVHVYTCMFTVYLTVRPFYSGCLQSNSTTINETWILLDVEWNCRGRFEEFLGISLEWQRIITKDLSRQLLMPTPSNLHGIRLYKGTEKLVCAWAGPEGTRRYRLPVFKRVGTCFQPSSPAAFTHQEIFLVLISVRSWIDPRTIVQPQELCNWESNPRPSAL